MAGRLDIQMARRHGQRKLAELAWQVHRERGEPRGYKGPCWGPTQEDIDEAARRLAGCRAHLDGFCDCPHHDEAAPGGDQA